MGFISRGLIFLFELRFTKKDYIIPVTWDERTNLYIGEAKVLVKARSEKSAQEKAVELVSQNKNRVRVGVIINAVR